MSGKPGRSGRKKDPSTLVNEAIEGVRSSLPELFDSLKARALFRREHICSECGHTSRLLGESDREALIYLIDRAIGKPKQQTELDIRGGGELGVGVVTKIYELMAAKRRELDTPKQLTEGEDATIKGEKQGQDEEI